MTADPSVVALGGGHGLAATLAALRGVTSRITAVVGVADDGGSSGRLRQEFGVLPPGDLRMALAALCPADSAGLLQFRFGGTSDLAGHALGNLLLVALWEEGTVAGLDRAVRLLGAAGRVLPNAAVPLTIVGEVRGHDPAAPAEVSLVRGQAAVAATRGEVLDVALDPPSPEACPDALAAIEGADAVILGPGSWFTSVLPHLLVPRLAEAIERTAAMRIVVLNLDPDMDRETRGIPMARHLDLLVESRAGLRVDAVVADPRHVADADALSVAAGRLGAELLLTPLASTARRGVHDPVLFGEALRSLIA